MKRPSEEILADLKGDDEDDDADDASMGGDEKKRAAGEELDAAFKSGDGLRIAEAFEDLMAVCGY